MKECQVAGLLPTLPQGSAVGVPESLAHWIEFSAYTDFRLGWAPTRSLSPRTGDLRKMIEQRKKLEDQLRKEQ